MANIYLEWQQMSADLKALKAKESKLRRNLCEQILGESRKPVTFKGENFKAKATPKFNIGIDESVLDTLFEDLSIEERASVKFKPVLVKASYNKLPNDSILHEAITEKPGMPTLAVTLLE